MSISTKSISSVMVNPAQSISRLMKLVLVLMVLMVGKVERGWGQINMSATGSNTQLFNTLATTGTTNAWADNSTIANWYSQRTGTGTTYSADAGTGTAGALYSYGTGTTTDRALGTLGSSNAAAGSFAHGVLLRNTSGSSITDIKVTYTLEEWRKSGVTAAQDITFYYKISTSTITSLNPNVNTGWTQVSALTLSSPINTTTAAALDGNAVGNKVTATNVSIPSLSLANNDYIMLKWEDPDHPNADHGLGIDDVTISWTIPVVAPEINITESGTAYATASTYPFGNIVSGSSSLKTFTIENSGTAVLTLSGSPKIVKSGTNASEFTVDETSTTSPVAAAGTTTFTITFSPTSQGAKTAAISIANDDANENPYVINLTGTGTVSAASDITNKSGYVYTSNVDYASYQTASTLTSVNSVGVNGLTIRDGGATTDADNLGTTLNAITFSTGGSTAIRTAALFDGTTNVKEVAVNGATSIAFTGLTLTATDGSTKDFELRVTYQSTVTDNQQITFTVSSATAAATGSNFAAANAGAAASSTAGDNNRIEVTATTFNYTQQPPSTLSSMAVMIPAVALVAQDANSNTDLDYAAAGASMTVTTGSTTFDASATTTADFTSGAVSFSNLVFNTAATANKITATSGALSKESSAFDVTTALPEINIKQGVTTYATAGTYGFGSIVSGASSSVTTFTIENLGTAILNLTGTPKVAISGTNAAEFTINETSTTATVAAAGTTTFTITFSPTSQGAKTAAISIANDDATGGENPYVINLTGTGTVSAASDITNKSGYVYTSNVDYASYQTASTLTSVNSVGVNGLTIRDGGATTDADNLGTTLNAITFSTGGSTAIRTAALFDGTTNVKEVAVNGATSIAFTVLTLTATDGSTKDFELRVTYLSTVTDNQQITFTVSAATAATAGSNFAAANAGAAASTATGDINRLEVTISQLLFNQQPSNVNTGVSMTPAVTVAGKDANNNTDLDFTDNVRVSSSGTMTGSPVLVAAVSGVATFSTLTHSVGGTGLTLLAERDNGGAWDLDLTSTTFTVTAVSATTDYFRSAATGDWGTATSWESSSDGTNWFTATLAPTNAANTITIRNGHVITIAVTVTYDQLVVDAGAEIIVASTVAHTLNNGTGTDLVINGTWLNQGGTWTVTGAAWSLGAGGTFIHNTTGGISTPLAAATLNPASTFIFRGSSVLNSSVSTSGRTFGNLSFESASGTWAPSFSGTGTLTVNGDFTVGSGVNITTTQTGIMTFAGNFTNNGTITNSTGTQVYSFTGNGKTISGSTSTDFETLSVISSAAVSLGVNISVASTFTATIAGSFNFSTYNISGAGLFTVNSGATLITANTLGLNGSITVSGTKTLDVAANYTFNGSLAQVTGLLLPATVNNLTISNTAGVTSSASVAVSGAMSVTGLFIPGAAYVISGAGTLSGSGTVRVTRTATTADFNTQYSISNKTLTSLTVDYSAAAPQTINTNTYYNLTISGSGANSKIADGDITVNGILALSSSNASTSQGTLDMSSYTLNMGTTATTTGTGDVTGIVKRTSFVANTSYSFGNSNTTLQITSGSTLPSSISVTTILSSTNLSWNSLAIRRYYDLAQSGGSSDCKVTFRAHYLEAPELNSNTETSLDFYDHHVGGSGHDHGHSNSDATNNWVELANLGLTYLAPSTGFGVKYWTLSNSTMANFTWLGVDATGWETQENWVGNTVPIASSNVVIPTSSAYTYEATLPTTTINSITIAAGAVLNGGSSTLTLTQSATSSGSTWENDGTFIAGTGNVIFANTGNPQTIAGGSATVFNDLTINGSNTVTLGRNTTVGGTLTFTSGNLAIGSNTLTLNGSLVNTSGTLTGSSTSNLTIGGTGLNQALNFTSGARSLNNLTLSTSAATATLGTALDVYGNIQLNDGTLALGGLNLTLKSNTTNTASIDKLNAGGSNLTGGTNVTVERFIKLRATVNGTGTGNGGRAYRALASTVTTGTSINANWQEGLTNTIAGTNLVPASPYQNFGVQITGVGGSGSGFDVTQNNQASLYTFTNGSDIAGSTGYPAVDNTNTNTLNALTGYFLYIRGDRNTSMQIPYNPAGGMPTSSTTLRATGTVQTGNKILPISGTSGHVSMITNPYPAPLDWQAIYSGNSTIITSSYTRWDSNNGTEGGFVTVDQSGFPYTEAVGRYIQPGEAFFVHSIGAGSEVLITEAMKAVGFSTNVIYRPTTSFESFSTELYLTEANAIRHSADGLLVKYHNNYSAAVDADDADEMNNWNENIAISRSAHHLAIEARPVIVSRDTIPLLMNGLRQTNYEWVFTPSMFSNTALKAELVDRFLNTRTLLSVTDSVVVPFTVTANAASADTNRFMVVFSPLVPLAIDGLSISAQAKTNGVLVNWSAQKETAMDRYELERSFTGSDFIKINTTAAIGNSAVAVNYNWLDGRPQAGINFYRIRAVDKAGQVKYTNVVKVNTGRSTPSLTVVPNPITGNTINLQLSDVDKSHYTLLLYNNLGQQVLMTGFDHGGGSVTKSIAAGNALSNGIYRVVLMNETGTSITTTLIKN